MNFGVGVGDFIAFYELASRVRRQIAVAPLQFRDISDEVQRFASILRKIERDFKWRLNKQQRTELSELMTGCQNALIQAETMLQDFTELSFTREDKEQGLRKALKKVRKAIKRSQWNPQDMQDIRNGIVIKLNSLRDFQDDLARDAIYETAVLDWISQLDYHLIQQYHFGKYIAGTGQWLIDSNPFKSWVSQNGAGILCYGMPGAGKTILTALIIDHLCQKYSEDNSTGIAYLYCDAQRQHEQNYANLVACLLKQLLQGQQAVPAYVSRLYNYHKQKQTRPSAEELSIALENVVTQFSKVFIIVDALDECRQTDRANLGARLSSLREKSGICFLATSRYPGVLTGLEQCDNLEIRAQNSDICKYFEANIPMLPRFISREPNLLECIKMDFVGAVDGMFLLAPLFLRSLKKAQSPNHAREIVEKLPKGPNAHHEEYNKALEKMEWRELEGLAHKILSLVAFSKRLLTFFELQHALAVKPGAPELDLNIFLHTEDIDACLSLVSLGEEDQIVRMFHYSALEYLRQGSWFPDAEKSFSMICVTYLSLPAFEKGICCTDEDFEKRLSFYPFYDYAACNWGFHVQAASAENSGIVLDLLENENKVMACSQAMLVQKTHAWYGYSQRIPGNVSGLHLATYFGLKNTVGTLLARGASSTSRDTHGRTPLSWAAEHGHNAIVDLLHNGNKVGLDLPDDLGRRAFLWASMNGHHNVVDNLLKTGESDINFRDNDGRTSLSYAAENGHIGIIQLLIKTGAADVNCADHFGRTPISWAAECGFEDIVNLLLDIRKVISNKTDDDGRTPISRAAENGHEKIVKMLLKRETSGADTKDNNGRTTLSWAAMNGHVAVINLLIGCGVASIDLKDADGRTPLSWAAGNGHVMVVQLLVNTYQVNVEASDIFGHSPLLWAAKNGHESVVRFLVNTGKVDMAKEDIQNRDAFFWAARNGHRAAARALIEMKLFEVRFADRSGRTALSWAAGNGHITTVELMLEIEGMNHDSADLRRRTPLSWAAQNGQTAIVRSLLTQEDVYPDSKDRDGRTPLSWAANYGHADVVALLVGTGKVNAFFRDKKGRTPLLLAATHGHERVVKQLLLLSEWRVGINITDHRGRTALSVAKDRGDCGVARLLEEKLEFCKELITAAEPADV